MTEFILENDVKIEVYNSIKELPIYLSKRFHHFILQSAGIGNTIEDVDDRMARLIEFIRRDSKDDILEEAKNLRFTFFSMLTEWDFKSLAFACLIKSVDDIPITDRSDESLEKIINYLSENGLTNEKVETILNDLKKNWLQKSNSISLNGSMMT